MRQGHVVLTDNIIEIDLRVVLIVIVIVIAVAIVVGIAAWVLRRKPRE